MDFLSFGAELGQCLGAEAPANPRSVLVAGVACVVERHSVALLHIGTDAHRLEHAGLTLDPFVDLEDVGPHVALVLVDGPGRQGGAAHVTVDAVRADAATPMVHHLIRMAARALAVPDDAADLAPTDTLVRIVTFCALHACMGAIQLAAQFFLLELLVIVNESSRSDDAGQPRVARVASDAGERTVVANDVVDGRTLRVKLPMPWQASHCTPGSGRAPFVWSGPVKWQRKQA